MSRLSMILNGWNCSHAFNKWGSSFGRIKVSGPNGGVSMGGSTILDIVKVKDCWTLVGNAVSSADYAKLAALARQDYITAQYPSPETGKVVTKVVMPTMTEATQVPIRSGETWYEGWTLTLEER